MIVETLAVGIYATNCYIVGSESTKRGMIIDPGADSKAILSTVDEVKLSIGLIVVTHSHFDHIGAVKAVKEATGAEYAAHEALGDGAWQTISETLGNMISGSVGKPLKPDRVVKDGDVIDIDDLHFTVLHTPGHSQDGISLVGHGVVFSGDTLFNFGIGRTDFPGCSHARLIESIHKKLMTMPDETTVFPGHGPRTTIGAERKMNPFLHG
jgi:glyoxylase-like metal-dependent hydrolase (beta-lactamase superfamily II)